MAKGKENPATRTRTPRSRVQNEEIEMTITDENPKYCTYQNPPGMKYVECETIDEQGKKQIAIHCLTIAQIERIKASNK